MFKSISTRTTFQIILVSLALLASIGVGVTYTTVAMQEDEILARGRALAKTGAATYGIILQRAVETGVLRWDDVAKPTYTEIHFTVPVAEPRYHSTFDWFTDSAGIQHIEDSMTASDPLLLYAVGNDLTGYIPTTLSAFSHPPTGKVEVDAVNARSKRRFESPMHKRAAAWTGDEPLVQEYNRDTGHVAWDVAQPIWLRNPSNSEVVHWGSFRIGIRKDKIAEVRRDVVARLGVAFLLFELALATTMLLVTQRQLRPLRLLVRQAEAVSLGESEDPIGPRPGDASEVSDVASAMRRMQNSLRMAMAQLPQEASRHPTQATEAAR